MSVTAITSRRAASALGTAELSRGGWACAQLHCLRLARIRIEDRMLSRRHFLSGAAALAAPGATLAGTKSLMSFDQTPAVEPQTQAPGAARRIPLRDFFRNPEQMD